MHDPEVVLFDIPRPWPQRSRGSVGASARRWSVGRHRDSDGTKLGEWWRPRSYGRFWSLGGRRFYWPAVVTVWHVEPGGRDSGSVCGRGKGRVFHVRHLRVQVIPILHLKRRLWSRCAGCGQPFRRKERHDVVSSSWGGPGPRWFRGEDGVYHGRCEALRSLRQGRDVDEQIICELVDFVTFGEADVVAGVLDRIFTEHRVGSRDEAWRWRNRVEGVLQCRADRVRSSEGV